MEVLILLMTKLDKCNKSIVSIICHNKKVRYKIDFYILHTVLLLIILLITAIICYHYANHRSKQKNIVTLTTKNGKQ